MISNLQQPPSSSETALPLVSRTTPSGRNSGMSDMDLSLLQIESWISPKSRLSPDEIDVEWIRKNLYHSLVLLPKLLELQKIDSIRGEVRVSFVNDQEMTDLHFRHLGEESTTDVLTFDLAEGASSINNVTPMPLDVDIAVCLDEARRQATKRQHDVQRELLLYSLHGVLHCLGFDDHEEDDYHRMHELEDRVLEAIGVGATFRTRVDDNTEECS